MPSLEGVAGDHWLTSTLTLSAQTKVNHNRLLRTAYILVLNMSRMETIPAGQLTAMFDHLHSLKKKEFFLLNSGISVSAHCPFSSHRTKVREPESTSFTLIRYLYTLVVFPSEPSSSQGVRLSNLWILLSHGMQEWNKYLKNKDSFN